MYIPDGAGPSSTPDTDLAARPGRHRWCAMNPATRLSTAHRLALGAGGLATRRQPILACPAHSSVTPVTPALPEEGVGHAGQMDRPPDAARGHAARAQAAPAVAGGGPGCRGDLDSVPGRGVCVGRARPPGTGRDGRQRRSVRGNVGALVVRAAGLFHPVLQPRPVPGGLRRGAAAQARDHRQRRDRGDARARPHARDPISPTSARTWRRSTASSACPRRSSRSRPPSPGPARPTLRAPRRSRTPRSCMRWRPVPPSTWSWFQPMPWPARRTLPRP